MINKSSIHAINAVIYIAKTPENVYVGAKQIAKEIDAPPNYLSKILQQLANIGMLTSRRGLKGGFSLAISPKEIRLFDIVEPLENISQWENCILGGAKCTDENSCVLHSQYKKVREKYLKMLKNNTIQSLI